MRRHSRSMWSNSQSLRLHVQRSSVERELLLERASLQTDEFYQVFENRFYSWFGQKIFQLFLSLDEFIFDQFVLKRFLEKSEANVDAFGLLVKSSIRDEF